MALYDITQKALNRIATSSFQALHFKEREDIQRMLVEDIEPICPDCMVLAEEFSDWQDSNRRIDILALDKDANLVVVELKRTGDGGHSELQAIRYAGMVQALTFDRAVEAHRKHLKQRNLDEDAEQRILSFLEWEEANEDDFAQTVRIVLGSADFSTEVTSTVIWLQGFGVDIRCVRLRPYKHEARILLSVEQVLPLPEAAELQVRLNEKSNEVRKAKKREWERFDVTLAGETHERLPKRRAVRVVMTHLAHCGIRPDAAAAKLSWRSVESVTLAQEGELDADDFVSAVRDRLKGEGKTFDHKRWYIDDDKLINVEGTTFAITKAWGARTGEALKILAEEFPQANVTVETSKN